MLLLAGWAHQQGAVGYRVKFQAKRYGSPGSRHSLRSVPSNPDRSAHFGKIEEKYGQPMSYWFEVMEAIADRKYPEQIAHLRDNHGFTQAHANAVVMYARGSTSARRFTDLDSYLDSLDPAQRLTVRKILATITMAYPDLDVVIAWNTPQVKNGDAYIFGVSAAKNHLLIAPWDVGVLDAFRPRLTEYTVNKKTIRVPSDWHVDQQLLRDLVAASLASS
jgi:uncharacterized protein YdhG (YjbR/CyaY superfamily)